jgi:hypothetical protein
MSPKSMMPETAPSCGRSSRLFWLRSLWMTCLGSADRERRNDPGEAVEHALRQSLALVGIEKGNLFAQAGEVDEVPDEGSVRAGMIEIGQSARSSRAASMPISTRWARDNVLPSAGSPGR